MERNDELAALIRQMMGVFETGDVDALDAMLSRESGVLGVGTDPREWWVDGALREAFLAQVPMMHEAGIRFELDDIQALSEGSVGWIATQPKLKLPDGNEVPTRLTGVLHQEDGAWKMVQFHYSMGIVNEDSIGEELPV